MALRGLLLMAAAGMLPAVPALARAPVELDSQVFVEHVQTDINGRARRVLRAPGELDAGDRLVFVVRYRNAGKAPVQGFAVTNPVPATLRIEPDQPAMQVSVDGGRSWGRLDMLSVPTPLGGTRRATAEDVTHVRWAVPAPLRPGTGGRISYRAVVR